MPHLRTVPGCQQGDGTRLCRRSGTGLSSARCVLWYWQRLNRLDGRASQCHSGIVWQNVEPGASLLLGEVLALLPMCFPTLLLT